MKEESQAAAGLVQSHALPSVGLVHMQPQVDFKMSKAIEKHLEVHLRARNRLGPSLGEHLLLTLGPNHVRHRGPDVLSLSLIVMWMKRIEPLQRSRKISPTGRLIFHHLQAMQPVRAL